MKYFLNITQNKSKKNPQTFAWGFSKWFKVYILSTEKTS
jgi:hypothetical protein